MNVRVNDVFSLKSGKYITLEKANYNGDSYIFVNKLDNFDEPTNWFMVFKCLNKGLIEEKDTNILKPLLQYFSEKANQRLELINDMEK